MYFSQNNKTSCCGCKVCGEICPQKCISFEEDAEGFLYPSIDAKKCIDCHLCEKVCPSAFNLFAAEEPETVVAVHKQEEIVTNSASGGAFTAIYEMLLNEDYAVYGVAYDGLTVRHMRADTQAQCEKFRKSKYVLGDTSGCYTQIAEQLSVGEKVLFSGTPCQCAALLSFLRQKKVSTEKLVTVDIVCHGGPNQRLFDAYLEELSEGKQILAFEFRNKRPIANRVNSRSVYLKYSDGTERILDISGSTFLQGYHARLFYRPSCATCGFAKPQRVTDLTIGDAWEVEKIYPEFDPLKGVSLILANTEKGRYLLDCIKKDMYLKSVPLSWAMENNDTLKSPTKFHRKRAKFFRLYPVKGFSCAVHKSLKRSLLRRILSKAKRILFH